MENKFCILFATIFCLNLLQFVENASSNEALTECGNVHHIEMHNFPNAIASYRNSKTLVCAIGNDTLPLETLNQEKSCPEDTSGICHNGHCIGGVVDALRVCSVEHSLDFHTMKDHLGTAFTNAQCMLKCVISGKEWSVNHLHEGSPCPANPNGVCRSGTCVTLSTNPGTIVTSTPTAIKTIPTTTITPTLTNVTQTSISLFSPSKMKLLNISLESADSTLDRNQFMILYYSEAGYHHICSFFHNPDLNEYNSSVINDIPNKLSKSLQMTIELFETNTNASYRLLSVQNETLYQLFTTFYENHKLAFGEQENFIDKFSFYRNDSPHEKLKDVGLRFTIVFSKD